MAYIRGENRDQICLLPESLDDYVAPNSVVRFIDRFVDSLDLKAMAFNRTELASTGRPPYSPGCLLRLFIYGYLHQHRSSRQLARQTRCNVELMWLLEKLTPEFKTIADFRKDNGSAIGRVVSQFRQFCRALGLYGEAMIAIDGSFFKASNSKDQVLSQRKLDQEQARIEKEVEEYLKEMDRIDAEESDEVELTTEELEEKIRQMEEMQKRYRENQEKRESLAESGESYRCLTDGDARMLRKGGKTVIGYNVQIAVDDKHHLIAGHEVTQAGNDRQQLSGLAKQVKDTMESEGLSVVADSGYHSRTELKACSDAEITTYVSLQESSPSKAQGRFSKEDFHYEVESDVYRCPAGEEMGFVGSGKMKSGLMLHYYRAKGCPECGLKSQCIKPKTKYRRINRWEHEHIIEANAARLEARPEIMTVRKSLAEHPFGTFKQWMGHQHFVIRGLPRVRTEMSLSVLAYNLKRAIQVIGVEKMIEALEQKPGLA